MAAPRLPDWAIYGAVVAALLFAAVGRRENIDAPEPPPEITPAEEGAVLGPASPFDPSVYVEVGSDPQPGLGTAFSIDGDGMWLTARHVVDGCSQAAVIVGRARGVTADVIIDPRADIAFLRTEGGPAPLPSGLEQPLRRGGRAFHLGFPGGSPGEATSRLLGRETLVVMGRGARSEPVLAWAETGRTEGLTGSLAGLSGAPALDAEGQIVGVTIAESPRRGRIYTTSPESLRATLRAARASPPPGELPTPITAENYGRIADDLRRELRIARVVCLAV
jgi:S1-C subfamily serine protease